MKAKSTTWCGQEITASVILEQILNEKEDGKLIKKVNTYVHKFHERLHSLNRLDKTHRKYFMRLFYTDTIREVKSNFEGEVQSYLLNVLAAIYRNKLDIINETW